MLTIKSNNKSFQISKEASSKLLHEIKDNHELNYIYNIFLGYINDNLPNIPIQYVSEEHYKSLDKLRSNIC